MGYSGAGGKLTHEKNQEQKISWHCPFKLRTLYFKYCVSKLDWYGGQISKHLRLATITVWEELERLNEDIQYNDKIFIIMLRTLF